MIFLGRGLAITGIVCSIGVQVTRLRKLLLHHIAHAAATRVVVKAGAILFGILAINHLRDEV